MIVAITGGIGAGKSYVCAALRSRGIETYDCDSAASKLMATSASIRQALCRLVGPQAYHGQTLQKDVLAQYLLQSDAHKQAVNEIVHPAVAADFLASGLTWIESAILFESGFDQRIHPDRVICVTAPLDVRVRRIMLRDHIGEEQAIRWIERQMPQERIRALSHYEIVNDGQHDIDQQINNIINRL